MVTFNSYEFIYLTDLGFEVNFKLTTKTFAVMDNKKILPDDRYIFKMEDGKKFLRLSGSTVGDFNSKPELEKLLIDCEGRMF